MGFRLFKCNKCGTLVFSMDDEPFGATCCGEDLVEQVPNSVDASFEKHLGECYDKLSSRFLDISSPDCKEKDTK